MEENQYLSKQSENNFKIAIEQLESTTEKTKAILLNNPNNPTGSVYSKKNLSHWVNGH